MNVIAKTLISVLVKSLPIRQIVAALASQAVNAAVASKDPAKIAEFAATADCALEAATVLAGVAQQLAKALADGKIDQAEADAIIGAAMAALSAWATGAKTPEAFKTLWRAVPAG
jgi:hypothetical protein